MPYVITSIGLASSYFFFMHAKEKAPKYKHTQKTNKNCKKMLQYFGVTQDWSSSILYRKKTESKMKNKVNKRTSECLSAVEASYVLGNAEQI